MTNPPRADQTCFDHLILALWNFALGEPAEDRIPQGENLRFVCNLVLGVWDFMDSPPSNRFLNFFIQPLNSKIQAIVT